MVLDHHFILFLDDRTIDKVYHSRPYMPTEHIYSKYFLKTKTNLQNSQPLITIESASLLVLEIKL